MAVTPPLVNSRKRASPWTAPALVIMQEQVKLYLERIHTVLELRPPQGPLPDQGVKFCVQQRQDSSNAATSFTGLGVAGDVPPCACQVCGGPRGEARGGGPLGDTRG
eukprot:CAMPEP_0175696438 /NCGR_PEP_ID=MMETSP0097-20121207/32952_1 /TAXON_ID=311494 /ORGANISM="Alexandrium monilatum, Strain CCMP3105" /LENGTH=106 /DNA_ID=CAMNT_0017003597 /DNA_START=13 /DNA_END=331 /DNA_ORIENTATION=+